MGPNRYSVGGPFRTTLCVFVGTSIFALHPYPDFMKLLLVKGLSVALSHAPFLQQVPEKPGRVLTPQPPPPDVSTITIELACTPPPFNLRTTVKVEARDNFLLERLTLAEHSPRNGASAGNDRNGYHVFGL